MLSPSSDLRFSFTDTLLQTAPRAIRDRDLVAAEALLRRMPRAGIAKGATKHEGPAEDIGEPGHGTIRLRTA